MKAGYHESCQGDDVARKKQTYDPIKMNIYQYIGTAKLIVLQVFIKVTITC